MNHIRAQELCDIWTETARRSKRWISELKSCVISVLKPEGEDKYQSSGVVWHLDWNGKEKRVNIRALEFCDICTGMARRSRRWIWELRNWVTVETVAVLGSPSLIVLIVSVDVEQHLKKMRQPTHRVQGLFESRGGRPGLPVLNSPDRFCRCRATFEEDEAAYAQSSGAVWKSRWPSWAPRP